jgi:hypothetical protein
MQTCGWMQMQRLFMILTLEGPPLRDNRMTIFVTRYLLKCPLLSKKVFHIEKYFEFKSNEYCYMSISKMEKLVSLNRVSDHLN